MKFGVSGLAAAAFLAASAFGGSAQAATIDKQLDVHVYQLCADDGSNCASLGPSGNNYFASQTNSIWAQAGINVNFIFTTQINDSTFLNIDDNSTNNFSALTADYGSHGASTSYVAMYLTHTYSGNYGNGYVGFGGLAIAMDSVMSYGTEGRLDTIAHELGHNLGLVPNGFPEEDPYNANHANNPYDLMASGSIRYSPLTASDISPSGLGFDQIPTNEINYARQSNLLAAYTAPPVPEPGEWAMMGLGLTITAGVARRRKARAA